MSSFILIQQLMAQIYCEGKFCPYDKHCITQFVGEAASQQALNSWKKRESFSMDWP